MNKIILQYYTTFKKEPPIIYTMNQDSVEYLELLKNSIETKIPLTVDDLYKKFYPNRNKNTLI